MTDLEIVSLTIAATSAAAAFISAAAAIVVADGIWRGVRAMVRVDKERVVVLDQQRQADERRHTEAMAALNELIRSSQRQTAALDELLHRTTPEPATTARVAPPQ